MKHQEYDVLISHASEDKEAIARPLAELLVLFGVRVWYDEDTLEIGDSLSESIDTGLASSRFGVVVLSRNFFSKPWARRELAGLVAKEVATETMILPIWHEPAGVPAPPSPEEPLAQRVLRQARTGQLDEDRLLPGKDKRERDLMKKLDKLAAQSGWYTFVSAQAHAIATGKAPARRNAEIMVVQEVTRWRREVERFALERLDEFDAGIQHALEHPAPLQRPEGQ